jgi:hypothetical protein
MQNCRTTVAATAGTLFVQEDGPQDLSKKKKTIIHHKCYFGRMVIIHNGLLFVFHPSSYVCNTYLPLYLDKERGQFIIQTWYPNAVTSVWVPSTMNAVISALQKKNKLGALFAIIIS